MLKNIHTYFTSLQVYLEITILQNIPAQNSLHSYKAGNHRSHLKA